MPFSFSIFTGAILPVNISLPETFNSVECQCVLSLLNRDQEEGFERESQAAPPYGVAISMGMQRRLLPDESAMHGWGPAPNQTQSS